MKRSQSKCRSFIFPAMDGVYVGYPCMICRDTYPSCFTNQVPYGTHFCTFHLFRASNKEETNSDLCYLLVVSRVRPRMSKFFFSLSIGSDQVSEFSTNFVERFTPNPQEHLTLMGRMTTWSNRVH